jgi:hypothetical protein
LNQAKNLPIDLYNKNIYIPLLVEKIYIKMFGGYQSPSNTKIELSNLNRFKKRLQIFTNNNDIDLFKNFNWKNIAITGSVMAAACRNIDPMEKDGNYTIHEFFNTYYKDSDIDVLVVLKGNVNPGEEIKRTSLMVAELSLEYNQVISRLFMDESRFNSYNSPLLQNIRREGIAF